MKLIDRYLLREFLPPALFCLIGFSMLFTILHLFGHVSDFIEKGTPPLTILSYYGAYLFTIHPKLPCTPIEFIAPVSFLLGALYALWQLTRHSELIAMRANGVPLHRLMLPLLVVSMLLSVLIATAKETLIPDASHWVHALKKRDYQPVGNDVIMDFSYHSHNDKTEWNIKEFAINKPNRLKGVKITWLMPERSTRKSRIIVAETAEWHHDQWWFLNAEMQLFDTSNAETNKPIGKPLFADLKVENAESISDTPTDLVTAAKDWSHLTTRQMVKYLKRNPGISRKEKRRHRVILHTRVAMPWMCLIATLIGIPAGARSGRQRAVVAVFWAIGLLFGYYAAIFTGFGLGRAQILDPFVSAWAAHIIFLILGIVLLFRMR